MKFKITLITFLILIISIIVTINVFFTQSHEEEMAKQINQQQLIITKTIASSIYSSFNHIISESRTLAKFISNRRFTKEILQSFVHNIFDDFKNEIDINIVILNINNKIIYTTKSYKLLNYTLLYKIIEKLKSENIYFSNWLIEKGEIQFGIPIKYQKTITGYIIIIINMKSFTERYFYPVKLGNKGYAWMMDNSGTLLYHPTESKMIGKSIFKAGKECYNCHISFNAEKQIIKEAKDIGFSSYIAPQEEDKLLAFSKVNIANNKWIICVSIPYSEVTSNIKNSMIFHSILVLSIFFASLGGGFVVFIANKKRIKAEKKAEKQILQSERLVSLSRLSIGIAHEIGNPLTSISSYIQILKDMKYDDFTNDAIKTIAKHINRISNIVHQMSSFTKIKTENIKLLNINELINSTINLLKYDKRVKNLVIQTNISNDIPMIPMDSDQLSQVFVNLILNAADAMSNSGKLTIEAHKINHEIEISFMDTGIGIKKEQINKIFDPFFTTKKNGTGLGLTVTYNIIKSFGGNILVESIEGKGSNFKVRLKIHET